MCANCARLLAEIEDLKAELGYVGETGAAYRARKTLGLTPTEFKLAQALWAGRNRPYVAITALAPAICTENALKIHVCHLRKKMGAAAVESIWGLGYKLNPAGVAVLEGVFDGA